MIRTLDISYFTAWPLRSCELDFGQTTGVWNFINETVKKKLYGFLTYKFCFLNLLH